MFLRPLLFRVYSKIIRYKIRYSGNRYPSSAPYISGDSFRALAQHYYEKENKKFTPLLVKEKDVVFVETDCIDDYFKTIHPHIQAHYILITHNSDKNITETEIRWIDEKIIHWFAQNSTVPHPKITPIPIGLENKRLAWVGFDFLWKIKKGIDVVKEKKIFYQFTDGTNPTERKKARSILEKLPYAETTSLQIPYQYAKTLAHYQFVASPAGGGIDCHRTWEAMYIGVIPIIKRTSCTEYFASLNLPMLIINTWDELIGYRSDTLDEKCKSIKNSTKQEALYMDFWEKKIIMLSK